MFPFFFPSLAFFPGDHGSPCPFFFDGPDPGPREGHLKVFDDHAVHASVAALRGPVDKLPWTKGIWFAGNIPRASLISWLAWLDRLATMERLKKWNVCPTNVRSVELL